MFRYILFVMNEDITVELLKALADKTRLDIVRKLVQEETCTSCSKVSRVSALSQPAMSHHLGKLVEAGVILEEKRGKEKLYTLNRELLNAKGFNYELL